MWYEIAVAISLVFIIEGILPFLYPNRWRILVAQIARIDDRTIRTIGLVSMLMGLALLTLLKQSGS